MSAAERAAEALQKNLPSRTMQPGYDPSTDPYLLTDLQAVAKSIASGGSETMPSMSQVQVEADLALESELVRDVGGGVQLVVPAGTSLRPTASLAGVPRSGAELRFGQIELHASGRKEVWINLRALGQNFPLISLFSATLHNGGRVSADYRIIHEDLGSSILEVLAAAHKQEHPLSAGQMREDLTHRDKAAHDKVDQIIRENIESALADAIRANATAISGVNLAQALGL